MYLYLRFTIDRTDILERMNIPDPQDISSNPTASTTTLETQVNPVKSIRIRIRAETERCGSTLAQLVQPSPPSVTPVVSMVRDTGGLEDQYRPMTPGEEKIMRIHMDGIYRTSDLTERTGGLWITGRISPHQSPPYSHQ